MSTTTIIILIVLAIVVYYIWMKKAGNLSFWMKVGRNPDKAYRHFRKNDAWYVQWQVDPGPLPPHTKYVGPSKLDVPSVGVGNIYRDYEKYREAQKELLRLL